MRIIEPEGRQIGYVIVIIALVGLYFGWYIFSGILLFIILPLWLFFCSSKVINPSVPNAIISPISGIIKDIDISQNTTTNESKITFCIKARMNGRIFSPSDLQDISIQKIKGFYGFSSKFSALLNANDTLNATSTLDSQTLKITIKVIPYIFNFCAIKFGSKTSLFLEKIGFLNLGVLYLSVQGKDIASIAKSGDSIIGGNTPLIIIQKG